MYYISFSIRVQANRLGQCLSKQNPPPVKNEVGYIIQKESICVHQRPQKLFSILYSLLSDKITPLCQMNPS
jgi:hypothetical protein